MSPNVSAHVRVAVDVPRPEDEAAAQLERIRPLPALTVAGRASPQPRRDVVRTEHVEQGRRAETGGAVGLALRVDEQREGDPGLVAERAGVGGIPEADRRQPRPALPELGLVVAQLRDVLPAEDSAVVAQEHDGTAGASAQREPSRTGRPSASGRTIGARRAASPAASVTRAAGAPP